MLTKLLPNLVIRSPNMVIYDQMDDPICPIWSKEFYCSNLVIIEVGLIWSTSLIQFGHLPDRANLVKSWCIPIWSPFVHMSSVLHQFGQRRSHPAVHTNLVTLLYIQSLYYTPIWSADSLCPLKCPIWSKTIFIENVVVRH
jgi:hypothetical protein